MDRVGPFVTRSMTATRKRRIVRSLRDAGHPLARRRCAARSESSPPPHRPSVPTRSWYTSLREKATYREPAPTGGSFRAVGTFVRWMAFDTALAMATSIRGWSIARWRSADDETTQQRGLPDGTAGNLPGGL